ncbi:zinc finger MYM-type protein 1-like [Pistacia vera]|uniref:zinc finger MYM-type protein 1-like n=1 Tax=Pistacia vera TaxID=55513 RepID=UPI0012630B84|nr:zinc finger MYM-type protein 1-like [Pistacia vera]
METVAINYSFTRNHKFPKSKSGDHEQSFQHSWFDKYLYWLEYSVENDATYCLCYYLFKPDKGEQSGGDSFVLDGFRNWKRLENFKYHIGGPNSYHNQAVKNCQALMDQKQHVSTIINKKSDQQREDYRIQLKGSISTSRFLLRQGLPFRDHDESVYLMNRGNFLELLHYTAKQNEEYRLVELENAPGHDKLIAPSIQKDIINAFAIETISKLISDLGDGFFSILVDEACDGSNKEQMTIILRYVNKRGCVVECLLSIMHVTDTIALSLKMGIETLFSKYNLSISRLRGQGYDGVSNMRVVVKKDTNIERLFLKVSYVINIVGWSPRHKDLLNEKQALKVKKAIESGELSTGQGLNQDTSLKRPRETWWGSHYGTVLSLINLFSFVIEVLEDLTKNSDNRVEASDLVDYMTSFDFAFNLHMMKNILGITFELSQSLKRKDQDIINAMSLVHLSKRRLLLIRNNGWDNLLDEVSHFCIAHNVDVPNMKEKFVARGRSRRNVQE